MSRTLITPLLLAALASGLAAQQPEKIDAAMNAKIKTEGMDHSKIMWIEHWIADEFGPRPIGSPNHLAAANWAVKTMTDWGMKNAHLEPFTWRGVGWLPGKATGFISAPYHSNVKFEAKPWSPSTKGTISGAIVAITTPENPTQAELTAYLTDLAPKVKGGIVMVGPAPVVPVNFCEPAKRLVDSVVKASYQGPRDTTAGGRGGRGAGGGGRGGACGGGGGNGGGRGRGAGAGADAPQLPAGHISTQAAAGQINTFVRDNMPGLLLTSQGGGRIPGEIVAQNGGGQIYNDTTPQPPSIILRNDDYGRIYRTIQDGKTVTAEFNVQNTFYPEGKTSYVTVGEIPGTDKADEVVMLGGHLDSWTSATGATDNGIGCAIMLEAARILQTLGAKPRRTIRVALWSGEEEGELGSIWYVNEHFGTFEAPKTDYNKLDAYWNIDDGTGLVRGASVFGPPAAAAVLAQIFKPWEDWGIYGASPSSSRAEGSTDSGAYDLAGLPGIGTRQDPIEYNSTTWHSNLDTYERIVPDDVMKNATMTASVVWHLANRDEMLPRFSADQMPKPQGAGGAGGGRNGAGANAPTGPVAAPHVYFAKKGLPLAVKNPALIVAAAGRGGAATPRAPESVKVAAKPTHGTLVLTPNGTFTYTPKAGYVGTDTFTYTLTRGDATSEPGSVTIVVR